MIRQDKHRNALHALNWVLVHARTMAYAGRSADLAYVLDVAEYLPVLMLEERDATDVFRDQLVGLTERFSGFRPALHKFDAE